ncbi:hypothetical protein DB41_GT00010 [Neochlamydia sp. TUME1]|nr:hypothetical protein DB41_GT00010 [Neochlamydia sp. TUME1]
MEEGANCARAGGQLLVSPARGGGKNSCRPGGQFIMSLDT